MMIIIFIVPKPFKVKLLVMCLQALLNNSYLYHMAHGKDFESRGIESKRRGALCEAEGSVEAGGVICPRGTLGTET